MIKFIMLVLTLILTNIAIADIYVVDVERVISESDAGKSAKKALEGKFSATKKSLEAQRDKLQALQGEIKQQSAVLSQEAMQKKIVSYRDEEQSAAKAFQDYQQAYTKDNNDKVSKIVAEVRKILEVLAKEKKAPMILEKTPQVVLYVSDDLDLTSEVLTRLNKSSIKF